MRTTLDIDDDVLQAAKELGRAEKKTAGQKLSELARAALTAPKRAATIKEPKALYGFKPLPRVPGKIVTNEMINKLRDEDPNG
jgi:hypothetical protein